MSYFPFIGQYYSERIFTLLYLCVFFTHIAIFNVKNNLALKKDRKKIVRVQRKIQCCEKIPPFSG